MDPFKELLTGPDAEPAIDEFFAAYRAAGDQGGGESAAPDVAEFLRARGLDVPTSGTLSIRFTEASEGVQPMRPVPDCPGGYCVPERCPDGVGQCGWICYCP